MSKPPWTRSFATFHAWIGERICFTTVDRGATAEHRTGHPTCLFVTFEMRIPRADGLCDPVESRRLHAAADRVTATLAALDPWLVGWLTTGAKRYFVWYLAEGEVRQRAVRHAAKPYKPEVTVSADPDWESYERELVPTPFQELLAVSNRQVHVLVRAGDNPGRVRKVDHAAVFADRAAAQAAAERLTAAGFAVGTMHDDDGQVTVEFSRDDTLEVLRIEHFHAQILSAIEPSGGDYDGWGCHIGRDI